MQFVEPPEPSPNPSERKTPSPNEEYELIGNNFLSPIEEEDGGRKISLP